ncbi:amidohydrolase [Aliidongia dinghuensis]|uniref:Amidohydrolase n=1 Tax=Aliidongia dinghuensis TaxID=1867774 RepID=A0A8J2Z091_9PROT|nr:amidohydrolase family protein [Aliidongia dinghuensis]GGF49488.1 amidohydrolase [Aliidongia dinghuensis]
MIIDVHSHVSPLHYAAAPAGQERWPCMKIDKGAAMLFFGSNPFRQLDARSWECERRLEDMDRDGIAMQVLSPMPELLSYWLPVEQATIIADGVNHHIAGMVAARPDRFRGLGAVPLQDVGHACDYLLRVKNEFGLSGIEIGSNVNGRLLGDRSFEPLWEVAAALSLSVFVHAFHPIAGAPEGGGSFFAPLAGFALDVGMSAASLLLQGIADRHPGLRLAFSHGGGALTGMLGRLDKGWVQTSGFGGVAVRKPSDQVRDFFFDSNVYDPNLLRFLAEDQFPDRVFVGTDYPYVIMQEQPARYLADAALNTSAHESVAHGCACRFLGGATP